MLINSTLINQIVARLLMVRYIYSKTAIQAVKKVWLSLAALHKMARVKKL